MSPGAFRLAAGGISVSCSALQLTAGGVLWCFLIGC